MVLHVPCIEFSYWPTLKLYKLVVDVVQFILVRLLPSASQSISIIEMSLKHSGDV